MESAIGAARLVSGMGEGSEGTAIDVDRVDTGQSLNTSHELRNKILAAPTIHMLPSWHTAMASLGAAGAHAFDAGNRIVQAPSGCSC